MKETFAAWESGAERRRARAKVESLIVRRTDTRREPKERLEENVGGQDGWGMGTARVCEDCVCPGRGRGGGYMRDETRARSVDSLSRH